MTGKQRVLEILQQLASDQCDKVNIDKLAITEALDSIEEVYREEEARMSLPNVLPTYYKHSCPNDIHVFVVLDDTETCIYCWVGDNPPKNQPNRRRWESK